MRYFIQFSYFGKHYFGYQRQPKQISVQQVLEESLSTLLRKEIKVTGAGRTDTGVHARKIFAHFDVQNALPADIVYRLNSLLPPDIAVQHAFEVNAELHARFDAKYRTYEYLITTRKDPFLQDFAWQFTRKKLDIERMNAACKILFEYDDFESFSKTGADNKTTFCKIYKAKWTEQEDIVKFTVSADRFLRNMVRAIVGTMIEIGTGKLKPEDLRTIIEAKDRGFAGSSAPAQGLFLTDVGYDFSS